MPLNCDLFLVSTFVFTTINHSIRNRCTFILQAYTLVISRLKKVSWLFRVFKFEIDTGHFSDLVYLSLTKYLKMRRIELYTKVVHFSAEKLVLCWFKKARIVLKLVIKPKNLDVNDKVFGKYLFPIHLWMIIFVDW